MSFLWKWQEVNQDTDNKRSKRLILCCYPSCLFLSFCPLSRVTVARDLAAPDTHQFEMRWMELLLLLGEPSGLHPLTKTLLICYWLRPAVALLWSLKTEKGMSGRIVDFNHGPAAHFDIALKKILSTTKDRSECHVNRIQERREMLQIVSCLRRI